MATIVATMGTWLWRPATVSLTFVAIVLLALVAAEVPVADEAGDLGRNHQVFVSGPGRVELTAAAQVIANQGEHRCVGDAILGHTECVAERIAGAGDANAPAAQRSTEARFSVELSADLEESSAGYRIVVRLENEELTIPHPFDRAVRLAVLSDRARFLRARESEGAWSRSLQPLEVTELRTTGKLTITVDDLFDGLAALRLRNPPVQVALRRYADPAKLSLPVSGIIPSKGWYGSAPRPLPHAECSCDDVVLARVEALKFKGMTGGLWGMLVEGRRPSYSRSRHFDLQEDVRRQLTVPQLTYEDQLCFYFTFPKEYSYMEEEHRSHPCKVVVKITRPHSRRGIATDSWQLYGIRGTMNGASAGGNAVCLHMFPEDVSMPAGAGRVDWGVKGNSCPVVEFIVK